MRRIATGYLKNWQVRADRKPLIIRGARQVGKSYLVRMFAAECFDQLVEVNFEQDRQMAGYFTNQSPQRIIALLEAALFKPITPGKTLLFLDEIQAAPEVLASLRFFYEQMPQLHIIAAGSLLEFVLAEHTFSMPVGRIEYLHLGPMIFEEFLQATGKASRVEFIHSFNLYNDDAKALHPALMEDFREYCLIGGMPGAIQTFLDSGSYLNTERTLESILATYRDDFNKYGNRGSQSRLHKLFDRLPAMVGQKFMFSNVDREEQSRDLAKALNMLELARIVTRIQHTDANGIPLGAEVNERHFKPLFLDIGLLCRACGLNMADLHKAGDLQRINSGTLCEQFVGQELLQLRQPYEEPRLYYWVRQKGSSSSEVDYLIQQGTEIIPVEVKAGKSGTLRSLQMFLCEKGRNFAVRFNADIPSVLDTQTCIANREPQPFRLLSLPFYLISQLPRLCRECRQEM